MTYPGGKGGAGVAQVIINQQPPHSHYIEPFAGSGAIVRAKRPALWNTVIDLDPRAIAPLAVLYLGRNFSTHLGDGIQWLIDANLRPDALVYCDPPYLMETRKGQRRLYRCEFDEDDHWRLLRVLRGLNCMVQISGYWSSLYAKRLKEWRLIRFTAGTRGGPVEECLWMNYPEPTSLHDWKFLGDGYRERERIRRKTARWTARIAALPVLERTSLLSAMASSLAGTGDEISARSGSAGNGGVGRAPSLFPARQPATSTDSAMPAISDRAESETAVLQ